MTDRATVLAAVTASAATGCASSAGRVRCNENTRTTEACTSAPGHVPTPDGDALGETYCRATKGVAVEACPPSDSGDWEWARCAARVQFNTCLYARAAELYRLAIERCEREGGATSHELAGLYAGYATSLSARGRDAAADVALRRAIALRPDWSAYWTALGETLERLGRRDQACGAHRHALELDPQNETSAKRFAGLGC
jgi:tetratricopeptide (TPR) repeat protein